MTQISWQKVPPMESGLYEMKREGALLQRLHSIRSCMCSTRLPRMGLYCLAHIVDTQDPLCWKILHQVVSSELGTAPLKKLLP